MNDEARRFGDEPAAAAALESGHGRAPSELLLVGSAPAVGGSTPSEGRGPARPGGSDALKVEALDCVREPLWGIPMLEGTCMVPRALACWTETSRARHVDGIHFFTEDYRFERVWNTPTRYRERLSKASVVCGPDFSVYRDCPRAANLWNVYRSRWLCALWESWGLSVAPTLTWAGPDSWSFCFLGVPAGVTVAVSTVGAGDDEQARRWFADGYAEAVRRLEPHCVLVYGKSALPAALEELAPVRYFGTPRIDAMHARGVVAGAERAGQLRMEGT